MASFPPELSHHSFDASDWFDGLSPLRNSDDLETPAA